MVKSKLSSKDLNHIIASASFGMVISDLDGHFIYVNPALQEMLGYSEDEIYHPNVIISHPDEKEKNQQIREQLTNNPNQSVITEKRYLHKNGQTIIGLISISAQLDKDKNIKHFIAQIINISDQKRIEKSASLFRHMINSSSEIMFIIDPNNGNILDSNISGCESLGYSYQEMLELTFFDIDSHMAKAHIWDKTIATIRNTKNTLLNGNHRRKNQTTFPVEMSLNYVEIDHYEYILALSRDISERKKAEQTIWHQANYDALTGLANRHLFYQKLEDNIQNSHFRHIRFALLCLDLDKFKEINDTLGHQTGDKLLVSVGERISPLLGENDIFARIGGDEFCLLIHSQKNTFAINEMAQNILKALATPFNIDNHRIYSSASIGISLFPNNAVDASSLLKQADQAMYIGKSKGRNRFQYFTTPMEEKISLRTQLSRDLHRAVAKDEFFIEYQQVCDFKNTNIHKLEALIRWQHPTRGLVCPSDFIPIAEENGTIDAIGDWVFHQAIACIQDWKQRLGIEATIAINASPLYFREGNDILSRWQQRLEQAGLPGSSIIIEITEGLLIDHSDYMSKQLLMLRDAGIQVALDDFGTGYSSLAYLNKLDIDYLKIDKSFLDNMRPHSNEQVLCEAIIVMAHKLKLQVIAEGIETEQQYQILQQMGCDYGQGSFFGEPDSSSQIELFL